MAYNRNSIARYDWDYTYFKTIRLRKWRQIWSWKKLNLQQQLALQIMKLEWKKAKVFTK